MSGFDRLFRSDSLQQPSLGLGSKRFHRESPQTKQSVAALLTVTCVMASSLGILPQLAQAASVFQGSSSSSQSAPGANRFVQQILKDYSQPTQGEKEVVAAKANPQAVTAAPAAAPNTENEAFNFQMTATGDPFDDLNGPSMPTETGINTAGDLPPLETNSGTSAYSKGPANLTGSQTESLRGSITSLKVVRGRSQIIKFAQPIMRISIADPALADVIPLAPDQLMINGLQRGVTSLIVWDENGQEGIFDLYVENDTTELLEAVNSIAPNEQIEARITDDSFILSGRVSSSVILDEIRRLAGAYGYREINFVDLTETPVPQVMLDVKIAEATKNVAQEIKIGLAHSSEHFGQTHLDSLPPQGPIGQQAAVTIGQLPAATFDQPGGLFGVFQWFSKYVDFQYRWDLLEQKGDVNTLAEPKLVCTHGREADFLAGGEFPYVSGVSQNGIPTVEFREYGVKLKFTPWIAMRTKRVELRVEPEVSQIDFSNCISFAGGFQTCGLLTRRTASTIELEDGESLLISGLLTKEEQNNFNQIPFIGDLPILGHFFKNSNINKTDKELIVVITPHIIKNGDYGEILGGP